MKTFTIKETATITGLTASVLRIWEMRYGWPKPMRKANGYRVYKSSTIEDLKWVASRVAAGKTIRELIDDDGQLVTDKMAKKEKPPVTVLHFDAIPLPVTDEGRRIREQCEQAVRANDEGKIAHLQNMAVRLRPTEREMAITAVLRVAKKG